MSHPQAKSIISPELIVGDEVQVYRNLHRSCYSVRRKGKVIGYTTELTLRNVRFKVSQKGRERVLKEQRKNVHAYVAGTVVPLIKKPKALAACTYNPYQHESFVRRESASAIATAKLCHLDTTGIWADATA